MTELLESVADVRSVSEPYPDRGCSVLVRVYVDVIPRAARGGGGAADIAYAKLHPDPYASWVNGEPPGGDA